MMIHFACPSCGQQLHVSEDMANKRTPCAKCREMIRIPRRWEVALERIATDVARLLICFLAAAGFGIVGYYVGQYKPFTGGHLAIIAEPYSPIRDQLAYQYAVVGAAIGGFLGLVARW